jgi:iron complex outermembrane recepter protein
LKIQSTRARLLASSMICGAAALSFAVPAYAQDQADTEVEAVVVTGSRIPQPNLTSTSPITVIGDQEVKLSGTTNVEQLVNSLPAAYAGQTGQVSNGATGTATVDLRGLGPKRTLVLVDGKRLMPGSPVLPVADLNAIPAALVDRVEVVTGGASAVYGSDAVSGVVNFIMKKDFEGVRLDAQYNFATHRNDNEIAQEVLSRFPNVERPPENVTEGQTWDLTAIVGANTPDGRGNATIYAGYRHQEPVLQSQYDFTACSMNSRSPATGAPKARFDCQGSANYNLLISIDRAVAGLPYGFFIEQNRTFSPWAGQSYNFGPTNYLQRPDERYVLGGFAHYEITPMFDVYLDTMFADDRTVAQIAPSGAFLDRTITLNCSNPLMSEAQRQMLCFDAGLTLDDDASILLGRRNIEGGPRQADLRHSSYRVTLGMRGELSAGWRYDIYGQYGTSSYSQAYLNEFSVSKFRNAINVVATPTGPQCEVTVSGADPSCVPYDLFGGFEAPSAAALAYVQGTGFQRGSTQQQVVSATITGDLGEYGLRSPWASDGIGVAVGGEYRRDALQLQVSDNFLSNDLWGQGGGTPNVPLSSIDVKELFVEARVPLVQDQPFFRLLQVEAGFRKSEYSTAGSTDAWKLAVDWQPVDDIRLRASMQRAVRAPNVLELFTPQFQGLFGGTDPCAGQIPQFSLAQCQAQGVSAAQYGRILQCPAGQCKQLLGGNPNLRPEESDTRSFGVVFTPTFFRGFNLSVDYFEIEIDGAIQVYTAPVILNLCGQTLDPFYCNRIQRDQQGFLFTTTGFVDNPLFNIGGFKATGVDVEANYRTSFADWGLGEWGALAFSFQGTANMKTEVTPAPEVGSYDCAGLYGTTCAAPYPEWRHRFRVTWSTPWNLQLSAQWRHLSSVEYDGEDPNPLLNTQQPPDIVETRFPAYNYLDLSATWTVRDGTTLRFGVNNVFDKDPPIVDFNKDVNINGNTYPMVYDALGRTWFVGITADF